MPGSGRLSSTSTKPPIRSIASITCCGGGRQHRRVARGELDLRSACRPAGRPPACAARRSRPARSAVRRADLREDLVGRPPRLPVDELELDGADDVLGRRRRRAPDVAGRACRRVVDLARSARMRASTSAHQLVLLVDRQVAARMDLQRGLLRLDVGEELDAVAEGAVEHLRRRPAARRADQDHLARVASSAARAACARSRPVKPREVARSLALVAPTHARRVVARVDAAAGAGRSGRRAPARTRSPSASEAASVAISVIGRYFMNSPTTPGQNSSGRKAASVVSGRGDDRPGHAPRRIAVGLARRPAPSAILPVGVLDDDDGAVDQHADRQDQAEQHDDVDRSGRAPRSTRMPARKEPGIDTPTSSGRAQAEGGHRSAIITSRIAATTLFCRSPSMVRMSVDLSWLKATSTPSGQAALDARRSRAPRRWCR